MLERDDHDEDLPVVLVIYVGEDDHDEDLLLRDELPESGHGGVQGMLGHDEPLATVEPCKRANTRSFFKLVLHTVCKS
jgi:hypothetical protein